MKNLTAATPAEARPGGSTSHGASSAAAPEWFLRNCAVEPAEGYTRFEGTDLHWLRWGDPAAPPLVLVHGGASHASWWAPLAPFLADRWCVIAPDLSGMGDSGWHPEGYGTERWADELLATVDAARTVDAATAVGGAGSRTQAAKPVLVGHSLGGTVVGVAGVRHPERVGGVVLCDIGVSRAGQARRSGRHFKNRITYPTAAEATSRFKLVPRQDCSNLWMVDHIARTSIRGVGPGGADDPTRPPAGEEQAWAWKFDWRLFARSTERPFADYLADLSRGGLPVACLNGADSAVATPEVAERVRSYLGAKPTVWIPEARHHLMLDQPIAFVAALLAILEGM